MLDPPPEGSAPADGRDAPDDPAAETLLDLPLGLLEPDPVQPRQTFDERKIRLLAESIKQHGLLQPLLVRPALTEEARGRYWIVAGERRWRAAMLLAWETIPCCAREYRNSTASVVALADNVHRADLTELEKAAALLQIKTITERTWDEVAELVKLSGDYVKRVVGLLKLQDEVKELMQAGKLSTRVAIALKPLPPRRQIEVARRAAAEGLSAEQVRALAASIVPKRGRPAKPPELELNGALGAGSDGHHAPVVGSLKQCAGAIEQIEEWVCARQWPPSRTSAGQRQALDGLHARVSLLQQELIGIRRSIAAAEEPDAEKLRRAGL